MLGVGLLEREERLLLVLAILIIYIITQLGSIIFYGLLLLAVLTNVTAVERLLVVVKSLSGGP
jgi:archaetidylinositol phosphate synthase